MTIPILEIFAGKYSFDKGPKNLRNPQNEGKSANDSQKIYEV
jgi:hypothetical protein